MIGRQSFMGALKRTGWGRIMDAELMTMVPSSRLDQITNRKTVSRFRADPSPKFNL